MAAFSIDNLLSKPYEKQESQSDFETKGPHNSPVADKPSAQPEIPNPTVTLGISTHERSSRAASLLYSATSTLLNPTFHTLYNSASFQSPAAPQQFSPYIAAATQPRFTSGIGDLPSTWRLKGSVGNTVTSPNASNNSLTSGWSEHDENHVSPIAQSKIKYAMCEQNDCVSDLGEDEDDLDLENDEDEDEDDDLMNLNSSGNEDKEKTIPEPRRMLIKGIPCSFIIFEGDCFSG